jgi:hypothetical protein
MSFVGLFPAMVLLMGIGANGVVNLQRVMSRLSGALITIRAASIAVRAVRRFVLSLPTLLRLRPAEKGAFRYSSSSVSRSLIRLSGHASIPRGASSHEHLMSSS